jgi:DNA processing protein
VVDLPPETRRRIIDAGRNRLLSEGLTGDPETSSELGASIPAAGGTGNPAGRLNRRIMEKLKVDAPIHLDALVESLEDCSPSELIAALFELEISGLAKQLPGKNFVKVW